MLSAISEAYRVFFQFKPPSEPQVREAAKTVMRKLRRGGDSLGFGKKTERRDLETIVLRILEENQFDLSPEKLNSLRSYLKDFRENERKKSQFWAQLLVSLIIVVPCLVLLMFTDQEQDTQKAIFGLLGTVLGYWLR